MEPMDSAQEHKSNGCGEVSLAVILGDQVSATDDPDNNTPTVSVGAMAISDTKEDKHETFEIDAILATWVPNRAIWPQLRAQKTPSVLPATALPFEEQTFLCARKATGICYGLMDSIMLPAVATIVSVNGTIGSVLVIIANAITESTDTRLEEELWLFVAVFALMMLPMYMLMHRMLEYPCRVFLYYRLWEQKAVIDFKQRSAGSHKMTLFTLVSLVVCTILGWIIGSFLKPQRISYYFVFLQNFGTTAFILISRLDIDAHLLPFNYSMRVTRANTASLPALQHSDSSSCATDDSSNSESPQDDQPKLTIVEKEPAPALAATVAKLRFISEQDVKYDIMALANMASHGVRKNHPQLFRVMTMWIGRLGHSKETVHSSVSSSCIRVRLPEFVRHELYAFLFLRSSIMYDDAFWHASGSFAMLPNRSGFTPRILHVFHAMLIISLVCVVSGWIGFVTFFVTQLYSH